MCGFLISSEPITDDQDLKHRGIEEIITRIPINRYVYFSLLPLQTKGTHLKQPVDYNRGWFCFNGEIFNYPDEYSSDVEFLCSLFNNAKDIFDVIYAFQGLDGFWAIWFSMDGEEYCFTDPLGKKQLYHRYDSLCSEIKPLLPGYQNELNTVGGAFGFLMNKNFIIKQTERTAFKDICRILPNTVYSLDKDRMEWESFIVGYYSWEYNVNPPDEGEIAPALYDALSISVKRRIDFNKINKTSILVSGGLDSTIIAYLASGIKNNNKIRFLGLDNRDDDQYITILEEFLGRQGYVINRLSEALALTKMDLINAYRAFEYPIDIGSVTSQYILSKAVKEIYNDHVLVTGDGADELFGGYSRAKSFDSRDYDVFTELPFYHNIRLDRIGMYFTQEIRSPFQGHDVVKLALLLPREKRVGKLILKEIFTGMIPDEILNRPKTPLRAQGFSKTPAQYMDIQEFFRHIFRTIPL